MINGQIQWRNTLITEVESASNGETRRIVGRNRVYFVLEFAVNAEAQRRDERNSIIFRTGAVVKDGASPWMTDGRR